MMVMHVTGTFATGKARRNHIIWSEQPIGTYATTEWSPQ